MIVEFRLGWVPPRRAAAQQFKTAAGALFSDYVERIRAFGDARVEGPATAARRQASNLWVCDRGAGAKTLSSEDLARLFRNTMDSGIRTLCVAVGGPDGFSAEELRLLKPELRWCFGPFTLPHELAAAVAAEQIYRAWTIVRGLPYHLGH